MPRKRKNREMTATEVANAALTRIGTSSGEISPDMLRRDQSAIADAWESMRNFITPGSSTVRRRGVEFPVRDNANDALADAFTYGSGALHIGIDPAAPNGDHAAVAVTTTAGEGAHATMTIESLQRARELMSRHPPYGRSPASDAIDATRMMHEAMRQQAHRGERPSLVDIQFQRREDRNQMQVSTRIRELRRDSLVDPDQLVPENFPRIAAEAAHEFARELESQILRALISAHEADNEHRYGQNRTREFIRHVADMAPGALNYIDPRAVMREMMGVEREPEKKGAFDWLTDFKHKNITHNGWTAKVLDTHEAVKEEADTMAHCINRSYTGRISRGEYLAVHIAPPADRVEPKTRDRKMPRTGFTLGFHKRGAEFVYDQVKGKKNDMTYCQDAALLTFVRLVDATINGKADAFWRTHAEVTARGRALMDNDNAMAAV